MKNIYFITLFLVIIAAVGYFITSHNEEVLDVPSVPSAVDTPPTPINLPAAEPTAPLETPVENNGVSLAEFQTQITKLATIGGMIPVEGFDAFLLLSALPNLTESDFDNVESLEGHYSVTSNSLEYTRDQDQPVTSAEQTISTAGYQTLLTNISTRLEISLQDTENLATILKLIQTDPTEIQIQNKFPEKIVYGDNMSLDKDALKADCDSRGGTFNTCGSVCPSTADMCTKQCAFTCELTDAPVF